jgi:hypothetical protein
MRRFHVLISVLLLVCSSAIGQSTNDSISLSKEMNEVLVKGSRRIVKGDTLSVTPSSNQKKFSMTGYELLRSLMLPGLRVNTINSSLGLADGSSVQVTIDGRPVKQQDIIALRPKEVERVEYIQTPGPEYGYDASIGAVINIVKKKRTDGYAAAILTNNALTTVNENGFMFGKYTHKYSEYSISVKSDYTSLSKRRINETRSYLYEDHSSNTTYEGMNTRLKYTNNNVELEYNHYVPGKHNFDVSLEGTYYYSPDRGYKQKVTENGATPYYQRTNPYEKYFSPRLNIYYRKLFTKSSSLTANFVGSYRNTDYSYDITEYTTSDFGLPSYAYAYGTKGKRQSYIGEVKYANRFSKKFGLVMGARGSYAYTDNEYENRKTADDKLHDTNIYTYATAYGYLGKLYYNAGVGLSGRIQDQNGETMDKWLVRPSLQFVYRLGDWKFNLQGLLLQESPSLSEKADAEYQINRYEIKRGNPDLDSWWKYRLSLRINGKIGPVNVQNSLAYNNAHHPVMTSVNRETIDGTTLFVTTFDNQKRMSTLSNALSLDCEVAKNLNLSASATYRSYQSEGLAYSHHLDMWQAEMSADWFAGHWNLGMTLQTRERTLSGENYSFVGANNSVYINYIIKNQWRFGLSGQYLFCKNGPVFIEEERNQYAMKSEATIVPAQKNMITFTAVWNFSAGKKRKSGQIDMKNEDTDSGIFK